MLLRAAIVLLVMLNLGAAGWWVAQTVSPSLWAAAALPQGAPASNGLADEPSLRLVTEPAPAPHAPPAAPPTSLTPAAPVTAAAPAAAPAAPALPAVAVCLRFGPFADAGARQSALTRLQQAGVTPRPFDSPARDVRGWKVYLPPQATREAAVAVAEKIKAAGISDLFVMTQGEETNSIALGRFGSEAAAQRRQAELVGKGFAARVAALGGSPGKLWLQARLPNTANRVDLVRIAPAQPLECSELH